MKTVLLDTCILIEILRGNQEIIKEVYKFEQPDIFITPIVVAELYRGASNKKDLLKCRKLAGKFSILPINKEVMSVFEIIFEQYALSHRPNVPDILIAAASIHFNIPIFTLNKKDFRYLPQLQLL